MLERRIPEPFWRGLAATILLHDPRQDVELSTSMVTGAVIQTIDTKIFSDRLDGPLTLRAGPVAEGCLRMLGG